MATYTSSPPVFKIEYMTIEAFPQTNMSEPSLNSDPDMTSENAQNLDANFCPLMRTDIRWVESDWGAELRQCLQNRIAGKVKKYNKYVAIWQARKLIRNWARGGVSMGDGTEREGFLGTDAVKLALMGL